MTPQIARAIIMAIAITGLILFGGYQTLLSIDATMQMEARP